MSFPRAKLQRFNDVSVCSPSPALYSPSPVVKTSLRSSFRNKLAKLTHKSPPASEAGSVITTNSTPCFRTPSAVPKKSKMLGFIKKSSKPTSLFKQDIEALKEKIVECHNKDEFIRELTEQIEEMKNELAHKEAEERMVTEETSKEVLSKFEELKTQLEESEMLNTELQSEYNHHKTLTEKLQNELTNTKEEHVITLHALTVKHNCELEKLLRKIHELKMELKGLKTDTCQFTKNNEYDLGILIDNMYLLERYYNKTISDFDVKTTEKDLCIANLNNALSSLKNKQENSEKELLNIKKELDGCKHELSVSKNNLETYKKKLNLSQYNLESCKKEVDLSTRNFETCTRELETCKKELNLANKLNDKHKKDIVLFNELNNKQTEEINKLKLELQQVISSKKQLVLDNEQTLKNKLNEQGKLFNVKLSEKERELQVKLNEKNQIVQNKLAEKDKMLKEKLLEKEIYLQDKLDAKEKELREKLVEKDLELFEELRLKEEEILTLKSDDNLDKSKAKKALKQMKKELAEEKQKNKMLKQHEIELIKKLDNLKIDSEAKLKQVEEDLRETNMLNEMTWQDKFKHKEEESAAILKECQAISEYNIIQSELEKNNLRNELIAKLNELDVKSTELLILKEEISKLNSQNKELCMKNVDLVNALEENTKKLFNFEEIKRGYDISLSKSLATIDTLKKRLLHSDTDVEALKKELEQCEISRLDFEAKCNQFMDDIEFLEKLNEDLELQHENTVMLMHNHIHELQDTLLSQLESFKKSANIEIMDLKIRLEEKEKYLQAIMDHLHTQQKVNCNAQNVITSANNELERLEEFATDFKFKNNRLETSINKLAMELGDSKNLIKELEATITKLESELQQKNSEYDELLRQVERLQDKYDSYYNYCEYYKNKTVEYEKEIEEMSAINKKYIETCGKYDQLLQDHQMLGDVNEELEKQVFELLEQQESTEKEDELFNKNIELFSRNSELEEQLKLQKKTIEKLKKEVQTLTASPKKLKKFQQCDKENILSPNRSLNLSFTGSPGPLRERNN